MKLAVGQRASRTLKLTAEHVRMFAEMTGDYNPLHFDAAFAAKTKFKNLVVQGGLTTGLLHALVAMDMPGPGTVFLSQNWKFTAPVFIGDTITAEAEVVIDEDDRRTAAAGVFFTRRQVSWTQRRMAASSRSTAWRVGSCGLQPNSCSSRPT